MAFSRFSFGVMAIVATLIFALVMPAAVHAQSTAPAPAPTSDGKWFSLFLHDARTHLHSTVSVVDLKSNCYVSIVMLLSLMKEWTMYFIVESGSG